MNRLKLMFLALGALLITILTCVVYIIVWVIFLLFFFFIPEKDFYSTFERFWKAIPKPFNEDKDE